MPAIVDGIQLITPRAIALITEEAVINDPQDSLLSVAVIAAADGGPPREVTEIGSFAQGLATFRSGLLVDLLKKLYAPAQGVRGAQIVRCYRINAATQSSLNLQDSTPANVLTLVSRDYGLHTAQLRLKVEAASGGTGYKATVQGYDGAAPIVKDNITRPLIDVEYTGAGSAATLTITASQLSTTVTDGGAGESVTLAFGSFTTVQAIADALTATGGYAVTVVGDPSRASNTLDEVSALDITTEKTLRADVQALADFLNLEEPYIIATRVSGKPIVTSASYRSFTGGSNGPSVVNNDFQNALTAVGGFDAQIVVVGSTDAAVHAMALEHANLMSAIGANKERVAIVGGVDGETPTQAAARALALNSHRAVLCYPGIKERNTAGDLVSLSPMYTAAAVAGVMAGQSIGTPGTRKPIRCLGTTRSLTPQEIDTLLLAGVLVVEPHATEGARIVQSITTFQPGSTRQPLRQELSSRLAADEVVRRVRDRLDDRLIGQVAGPLLGEQARSITDTALRELQRDGVIVGDEANPAYRDISVNLTVDVVTVSFAASVAAPGNYVVLRASLGIYSG